MAKDIIVLTIHGMGRTRQGYHLGFEKRLKKELGGTWSRVQLESVYYQDLLQNNQDAIYKRMSPKIRLKMLRKFVISYLCDAASLEYDKGNTKSVYEQTQRRILEAMLSGYRACGERDVPVVFVAYSLGCQVLSNYIWDSQQQPAKYGVFKTPHFTKLSTEEKRFGSMGSLYNLFTCGCNIPVFIAGLPKIEPFRKPSELFRWDNYYDEDDILGWPLAPLENGFEILVRDHKINAGLPPLNITPASHLFYFTDADFVRPVARRVKALLGEDFVTPVGRRPAMARKRRKR